MAMTEKQVLLATKEREDQTTLRVLRAYPTDQIDFRTLGRCSDPSTENGNKDKACKAAFHAFNLSDRDIPKYTLVQACSGGL